MIINNWHYLSQRNNTDVDLKTFIRKPNKSTQCMISSFAMWCLQFGFYADLELWKRQWNPATAEEILYLIIMNNVINLNKEEETKPESERIHWTRFMSEVFRRAINPMIERHGWQMAVKRNMPDTIASVLDTGQGVVVGTNISSFLKGASGHIQYFIGYEKDSLGRITGFYSCDPYGDCRDGYKTKDLEKGYVFYGLETIKKLFEPFGANYPTLCSYAVRR